MKLENTSI